MGVVYKARDTRLDRLVALKFLPPERVADSERKRRFIREARAASALNHPSIITVHEIAEEGGADFIVMEHVSGRTLSQVIAGKPLPLKEALGYAVQIADALIAAHRAGIIHRDLKPGNVMVTEDGRVKILDFGLAKLAEAAPPGNESTLTLVAGTAAYMAPEQAEGQAADARSDIYAFGAVLYEMLAGRRAFSGLGRDEPAPLTGVPTELQQVVARCLRRDPAGRFQTAAELKAALETVAQEPQATPSIAVLPFANLSADKENEYFSDGLAEEIINALTKLPGLRVAARTSSFAFRGRDLDARKIGAELNVGQILEGSVRKAGERIRVTAQLINVADGYHLWSERYDRRMADVFDIQDEIAQAIVDRLRVQFTGEQPLVKRHTANLDAYHLYLKGRYWWNTLTSEGFNKAVECFERAIAQDPGFALPYTGLVMAYAYLGNHGWTNPLELMPKAKNYALKALVIDETLAEAHWAHALVLYFYDWDWLEAESEFRRAIALNPRDATIAMFFAFLLIHTGRTEEALAQGARALALEPVSVETNRHMTYLYCDARRFDQAIAQGRKTVELHPHYASAYLNLGLAYLYSEMYGEAVETFQAARVLARGDPLYDFCLACVYARSGKQTQAWEILGNLERLGYGAMWLGWLCAALGDRDRAFGFLEKAYQRREGLLASINVEPVLDPLRSDPRFADLVRRIGLEVA